MIYPLWCTTCDALTGHKVGLKKSTCLKCGGSRPTPLIKWTLGPIILIEVMILMAFFIYHMGMSIVSTV